MTVMASLSVSQLALLLFNVASASASASASAQTPPGRLTLTGLTVQVNEVPYHVPPQPVGRLLLPPSETNATSDNDDDNDFVLRPMTVITCHVRHFTLHHLENVSRDFSLRDDVFQDAFLQGVYLQDPVKAEDPRFCERSLAKCDTMHPLCAGGSRLNLPQGPYFVSPRGFIFEAYRLYPDTQEAFSEAVISRDSSTSTSTSFSVLPSTALQRHRAVAVPSRLYFEPSEAKPLAGLRLGVKDIYDVKGLRTSNGNRAWYELYPPSATTAPAVQNLLDAGAILVGKMTTSQFANGETATADWVDFHSPFNPRGDGYQDGSSSSTGPASGIAAYPWLDISLGSDTGGSIRSPSQVQGIYGNRPSHGLVSMQGVTPLAPLFDTAGVFARDPRTWIAAATVLYRNEIHLQATYPSSVLKVGMPSDNSTELNRLLNTFLLNLTTFLSANVSAFDVERHWKAAQPGEQPLSILMNQTYELITAKEQSRRVRDKFYRDYAASHDGRRPFVDPSPIQRWQFGDNSSSTLDELVQARDKFMEWFNKGGLPRDDKTCSKHLLIYARTPKPIYRDTYLAGPSRPFLFSPTRFSVYSGAPDVVVPIGEVAYFSRITNETEMLPVTVDLMAAKGCDGMIFSLVNDLHAKGLLTTVKAGRSLVSGQSILQ